jgi:4-amino-4-deoxy-L-arabinose transferase-like glycosyltransferase
MKRDIITILSLFCFALALRLLLFSGFVLGDDPGYANLVSIILSGNYPGFGPYAVFGGRPLLMAVIAIPIRIFGWYEWSFVLPFIIASILNLLIVYLGAVRLSGNRCAGVFAALFFATFPLDVVHATTLTNDILLSSFIWGGSLLLLYSYSKYDDAKGLLLITLSGFFIGLAIAVKINALVAPVILFPLFVLSLRNHIRQGGYRSLIVWIAGWVCANALICGFMYLWSGGDFIAHYHVEMNFNKRYNPSGYIPGKENLVQFLLLYPRWITGLLKEGPSPYASMSYGVLFLLFLICSPLAFFPKYRGLRLPVLAGMFYLLVMQFSPLKIQPDYVPIHRLPRFLYIASMPAAIAIGIAAYEIFNTKKIWLKVVVITLTIFSMVFSIHEAWKKGKFYQDCIQDSRWAWTIVKDSNVKGIVTDSEMRNYLMFRSGYEPPMKIHSPRRLYDKDVQPGDLIISGGARRPEMFFNFASEWHQDRDKPQWFTFAKAPFQLRAWRTSGLELALVQPNCSHDQNSFESKRLKSRPWIEIEKDLRLVAELDVGNANAEKQMNYTIKPITWSGDRNFAFKELIRFKDDGRAHKGEESMTFNVTPNRKLFIVKRFDSGVTNQMTEVFVNGRSVGKWLVTGVNKHGRWEESKFVVPDDLINSKTCNVRFKFLSSDVDINSFYYWFYQPE